MSSLKEVHIQALEALLDLGASVDFVDPERYKPSLTALEAVIYQANHHALEVILRHTNCFNSPKDSLLAALEQAEDNVAERHPRAVSITVLKADLSQRCYDMHTSTANAKSDARCCLAIILTLVKLNYLMDAEGVSRIEAVERNYDRFSQSRSNEDSNSVLASDSDFESSYCSSEPMSDDESEDGHDDQDQYEQPLLPTEGANEEQLKDSFPAPGTEIIVGQPEKQLESHISPNRSQNRKPRRQQGTAPQKSSKHYISVFRVGLMDKYSRISSMSILDVVLFVVGFIVFAQLLIEIALWRFGKWILQMVRYRRAHGPFFLFLIIGASWFVLVVVCKGLTKDWKLTVDSIHVNARILTIGSRDAACSASDSTNP